MARGGARLGAGRPKNDKGTPVALPPVAADISPLAFLLAIMRDPAQSQARRTRAAALLLPFMHQKAGAKGKKEERQAAGENAASGKFAVPSAPRLAVVTTLGAA